MKLIFGLVIFLVGCATGPGYQRTMNGVPRDPKSTIAYENEQMVMLRGRLGMERDLQELGLQEKAFDSCRLDYKEPGKKCGARVLGVLNFRLLCRDTEDTTDRVVSNFRPLVSDHVEWRVGDLKGLTRTDAEGYGQLQVVANGPVTGERLVLVVGKQFLGLELNNVGRFVLPRYWCQ